MDHTFPWVPTLIFYFIGRKISLPLNFRKSNFPSKTNTSHRKHALMGAGGVPDLGMVNIELYVASNCNSFL